MSKQDPTTIDVAVESKDPNRLGLFRLSTTVITLVIGGGIFTMSGDMAAGGSGSGAVAAAWGIAGVGVLALLLCFYGLTRSKVYLKGGIYAYAEAGFGKFTGFSSAWGYWLSAMLGTVGYCSLLFGAMGYFFPVFETGTNLPSVIGSCAILVVCAYLVSRGIREVTGINAVITVSKLLPIFVAIVAIVFLQRFDVGIFLANWSGDVSVPFFDQVSSCMSVTVWAFIGIEGAVAISGRAKRQSDVGKATMTSFFCVLTIYLLVSLLSMGILPHDELAALENPAFAGVMEAAVGPWGATIINLGVILSMIGAMLGFTLLACESPYEAAQQGVFIKAFARTNKNGAPIVTLVVSTVFSLIMVVSMLFSDNTYQVFYTLSASMILLPYLLSAAYFVKCTFLERDTIAEALSGHVRLWSAIGVVGVGYSFFLYFATGITAITTSALLYAPGIIMYVVGAKQRGQRLFETPGDKIMLAIILVLLAGSVYLIASGQAF